MRGALRTSRTRGGMRWTRMARETHAPDAYGEVAWFGRRGAGAKLAIRSAGDGGKRAVLREEREVSRKATAQGRPGCSAVPVCSCALLPCALARETAGAASTRFSLRPPFKRRATEFSNLGRNMPRDRESMAMLSNLSLHSCIATKTLRCLGQALKTRGVAADTHSVLSASSSAKEPHCSQTCRKCVWNFHGDN